MHSIDFSPPSSLSSFPLSITSRSRGAQLFPSLTLCETSAISSVNPPSFVSFTSRFSLYTREIQALLCVYYTGVAELSRAREGKIFEPPGPAIYATLVGSASCSLRHHCSSARSLSSGPRPASGQLSGTLMRGTLARSCAGLWQFFKSRIIEDCGEARARTKLFLRAASA